MPTDTTTVEPETKSQPLPKSEPKAKPAAKDKAKKPSPLPPYHVILLDDNDHSYEYVMEMLKAIFGYAESIGFTLADRVDRQGKAVVFTTHRELAELKCEQIHAFGNDWRVATCSGSMTAVIRAAEG